jgi:hypothetical protein
MNQNLFSAQANTIAVSATAAASTPVLLPFSANGVRIVNEGPNVAFIAITAGSTNATLPGAAPGAQTCTPVLAGSDVTLAMASGQANYISAICRAAGTAVMSVSTGEGT